MNTQQKRQRPNELKYINKNPDRTDETHSCDSRTCNVVAGGLGIQILSYIASSRPAWTMWALSQKSERNRSISQMNLILGLGKDIQWDIIFKNWFWLKIRKKKQAMIRKEFLGFSISLQIMIPLKQMGARKKYIWALKSKSPLWVQLGHKGETILWVFSIEFRVKKWGRC